MIENKFDITEAGLIETSTPILKLMPRIRKLVIGIVVAVAGLVVLIALTQEGAPLPLLLIIAGIALYSCLKAIRRMPMQMARTLYRDLKQDAMDKANPKPERDEDEYDDEYEYEEEEPAPLVDAEPFSHIRVNEGGILIVGLDDEGDLIYPFSRLTRVIGTEHFIVVLNDQLKAITFHRDGFTQGSAEELIAMLREHCPNMKFGKGL